MSNLALYRKYRPQIFRQIKGQDIIVQTLLNVLKNKQVKHAYIFAGPRGTGKTSIAKIFAKAMNCLNPVNGDACNECKNCIAINSNKAIDFLELDAASNNGVEQVRTIIDNVNYLPYEFSKKNYVIDEAHMLSTAAWNAFLKTLEEPPEHAVFIFATTEVNKIPVTILSRCQRFDFHKLSYEQLEGLIDEVCNKEDIIIDGQAKTTLIKLSDGAARDCLSLLDQLASLNKNYIDYNTVKTMFGLSSVDQKLSFLISVINKDLDTSLKTLNDLEQNGLDALNFLRELIQILMDYLIYLKTQNETLLKCLDATQLKSLSLSQRDATFMIEKINHTYSEIKKFAHQSFYLEFLVFELINSNDSDNKTIKPSNKINKIEPVLNTNTVITNLKSTQTKENNLDSKINTIDLSLLFTTKTRLDVFNVNVLDEKNGDHLVDESKPIINPWASLKQTDLKVKKESKYKPITLDNYDDSNMLQNKVQSQQEQNHKLQQDLINENLNLINHRNNTDKEQDLSEIENNSSLNSLSLDYQELFLQIKANKNNKKTEELELLFENYKDNFSIEKNENKQLSIIRKAEKVYAASNNGMILLFEHQLFSDKFNEQFQQSSFYLSLKNLFKTDLVIIGVARSVAKQYLKLANEKPELKHLQDVKLKLISHLLESNRNAIKAKFKQEFLSDDKIKPS